MSLRSLRTPWCDDLLWKHFGPRLDTQPDYDQEEFDRLNTAKSLPRTPVRQEVIGEDFNERPLAFSEEKQTLLAARMVAREEEAALSQGEQQNLEFAQEKQSHLAGLMVHKSKRMTQPTPIHPLPPPPKPDHRVDFYSDAANPPTGTLPPPTFASQPLKRSASPVRSDPPAKHQKIAAEEPEEQVQTEELTPMGDIQPEPATSYPEIEMADLPEDDELEEPAPVDKMDLDEPVAEPPEPVRAPSRSPSPEIPPPKRSPKATAVVEPSPPSSEEDDLPPAEIEVPVKPARKSPSPPPLKPKRPTPPAQPKKAKKPIKPPTPEPSEVEEEEEEDEHDSDSSGSAMEDNNLDTDVGDEEPEDGEDLDDGASADYGESEDEGEEEEEDKGPKKKKKKKLPPVNMRYEDRFAADIKKVQDEDDEGSEKPAKPKKVKVRMVAPTAATLPLKAAVPPPKVAPPPSAPKAKPVKKAKVDNRLLASLAVTEKKLMTRQVDWADLYKDKKKITDVVDDDVTNGFRACWRDAVYFALVKAFGKFGDPEEHTGGSEFESGILDFAKPRVFSNTEDTVHMYQQLSWYFKKVHFELPEGYSETSQCTVIFSEPWDTGETKIFSASEIRRKIYCLYIPAVLNCRYAILPWQYALMRATQMVEQIKKNVVGISRERIEAQIGPWDKSGFDVYKQWLNCTVYSEWNLSFFN